MPRVLDGMARLDYPVNLGRGPHLKLAWKLGQELRLKPGAGAAPTCRSVVSLLSATDS